MEKCAKNATYISKTSQNEFIKCCGDVITDELITTTRKAKYYAILADEASDISNKEQLSLVIRFFDVESNRIREELWLWSYCKRELIRDNGCVLIFMGYTYPKKLGLNEGITSWGQKHRIPHQKLPIWSYSQV